MTTYLNDPEKGKEYEHMLTRNIPLGCLPTPEDCAKQILYLLSDTAYAVNGVNLTIDGGQTAIVNGFFHKP